VPYADLDRQREYQRQWTAKRRSDWLEGKSCVVCGSVENLQIDHIDPTKKISHRIWTWSTVRRDKELAKCQVLCWPHHQEKTRVQTYGDRQHGTRAMYRRGRCKCAECESAKRAYDREWIRAKRARLRAAS